MQLRDVMIVIGALHCCCAVTLAHQPILSDGSAVNIEQAIPLEDVQISRVVYHEVTPASAQIWLSFEIDEPQSLKLQLGVPYIDRFESYRPAMVILGPGLPNLSLPFPLPSGLGGILFDSRNTSELEFFDEPFTGTQSWIVAEAEISLPVAGRYYVVAYSPTSELGKLWIALGEREVFEAGDLATFGNQIAAVRAFHEIPTDVSIPCFLFPVAGIAAAGLLLVSRKTKSPTVRCPHPAAHWPRGRQKDTRDSRAFGLSPDESTAAATKAKS